MPKECLYQNDIHDLGETFSISVHKFETRFFFSRTHRLAIFVIT